MQQELKIIIQLISDAFGLSKFSVDNNNQATDWKAVLQTARQHKVIPMLYTACLNNRSSIPTRVLTAMERMVIKSSKFNLLQKRELQELILLFQKNNIRLIPYKGVILAEAVYDDLSRRDFTDIDLIIKADDYDKMEELLLERGYGYEVNFPRWFGTIYKYFNHERNFDIYVSGYRHFHVEPHWTLGSKSYQTHLDYDDIKLLSKPSDNSHALKLKPEGLLITTALHHSATAYECLKYVNDITAILLKYEDVLDWKEIKEYCIRYDVLNLVLVGVALAMRIYNIKCNEDITHLVHQHITDRQIDFCMKCINAQRPKGAKLYLRRLQFQLITRRRGITKFKILYHTVLSYIAYRPLYYLFAKPTVAERKIIYKSA